MKSNEKVLNQDLNEKAPEQQLLMAQLLFLEKPKQADSAKLQEAIQKLVGPVDNITDKPEVPMFSISAEKFAAQFKDAKQPVPVLANYVGPVDFCVELDDITSSQFWDMKNGEELIQACKYSVSVFGMLASALPYEQQAELFLAQIEAALECYPDCKAIYVPHSGKLTSPEAFLNNRKYGIDQRFILVAVNARFFRISNSEDMVVDTLGLHVFGAPDVQVHFHGMNPDHIVEYVYNIASYQFTSQFALKSGDTVDGIDDKGIIQRYIQWRTQYENSLIQPMRAVVDINCGEYAAGARH